jgi:RNA-directed DNA polymerase
VSVLQKLKEATTLHEIADLLGYSAKGLSYVLYQLPMSAKYKTFSIKKKDGTDRTIKAPTPELKKLQKHLANLLYACRAEMEKEGFKNTVSHGFRRGHSIVTNAEQHRQSRFVFNLDLQDYFPTFTFQRVRGFFIKDKQFALHEKVATIIAQIACDGTALPQGSPCSPVISDLVGQILDQRLVRLAKRYQVTYSRYADDITFSTRQKEFPSAIACEDPAGSAEWQIGLELLDRIENADFIVNPGKTRMSVKTSRQSVTGLVVNAKVNVASEYFRNAKAMCRTLFNEGRYYRTHLPPEVEEGEPQPEWTTNTKPLHGVISHIHFVKSKAVRRDLGNKKDLEPADRKIKPPAARTLFRKFLFYTTFVAPDRLLIVAEGKTDIVYLREAIKRLPQFHPVLGQFVDGKFQSAVRLFRYPKDKPNREPINRMNEILEITGGAGGLRSIVLDYDRILPKIIHRPMAHPVTLLLDNDDGLSHIDKAIKGHFGVQISKKTTLPSYHLAHNLYVVKTPESGEDDTFIEQLFPQEWLDKPLGDKKFNPNKKHGAEGEYGKAEFAEKIVRPNANEIEFGGFSPLLDRIVDAMKHHYEK